VIRIKTDKSFKKRIDELITVSNDNAFETARKLAEIEGILCKISSGASA